MKISTQNETNDKISQIHKSIIDQKFEISLDILELPIDMIIANKDELFKSVPILKDLTALYKIGSSIREIHTIKKIIHFLDEINQGAISEENKLQFLQKIEKNKKYKYKVLETILVRIENFTEINQTRVFANLFVTYVNNKISFEELNKLTFILNMLHPNGYLYLNKLATSTNWKWRTQFFEEDECYLLASGVAHRKGAALSINQDGQNLYNFGIAPVMDNLY